MALGKGASGGKKSGGTIGTRVRQAVTKGKDKKKEKEALKSPKTPRPKVQEYEAKKAAAKEAKLAKREEAKANYDPDDIVVVKSRADQQKERTLDRAAHRQLKSER